jgi:hypothetical protein
MKKIKNPACENLRSQRTLITVLRAIFDDGILSQVFFHESVIDHLPQAPFVSYF